MDLWPGSTGPRAVKYSFHVMREDARGTEYRISLGSYATTNAIARQTGEIEEGQRLYHLDGYYQGGKHATFGFFTDEKDISYDSVRAKVVAIVEGKLQPTSSFDPGSTK